MAGSVVVLFSKKKKGGGKRLFRLFLFYCLVCLCFFYRFRVGVCVF